MYIFSAVRDTQLGQLMFAIESLRMKRKRQGEDPGPGLLEGENATTFIPLFALVKQFQDYLDHEDSTISLSDIKSKLLKKQTLKKLDTVAKQSNEWYSTLPEDRLDELYIALVDVAREGIFEPLIEAGGFESHEQLMESIKAIDEGFVTTVSSIFDPVLASYLAEESFTRDDSDNTTRQLSIDGKEVVLTYSDYHMRVNLLYGFVYELSRFLKVKSYNFTFEMLEPYLTLEMLLVFPQPDKQRVQLARHHLNVLSQDSSVPSSFWDILYTSYQAFSQAEEGNQRILNKLMKNYEKTLKEKSRQFWKLLERKQELEPLLAILWCHFRAIQTQAQYQEQQMQQQQHSLAHSISVRFEHIFWFQGRDYLQFENINEPMQFWASYASIANKQIRSPKDSLALFHELDELLNSVRVLTNKQKAKKLQTLDPDKFSLLQRVLSYGLEARDTDIHPQLDKYVGSLDKLLDGIDPDDMHESFSLKQEKEVVSNIRTHMKNQLTAQQ